MTPHAPNFRPIALLAVVAGALAVAACQPAADGKMDSAPADSMAPATESMAPATEGMAPADKMAPADSMAPADKMAPAADKMAPQN